MRSAPLLAIGMSLLACSTVPPAHGAAKPVVLAAALPALAARSARIVTQVSGVPVAEPMPPAWRGGPPVRAYDERPTLSAEVRSVRVRDGRVELRWSLPTATEPVNVYRRDERGTWEPVGSAPPDPAHEVVHTDGTRTAGARVAYCVGVGTGGGEAFGGVARVEIPGEVALGAHTLRVDPATGRVRVGISLPEERLTTLALVDASGRRLWTRDLMPAGSGVQEVLVDDGVKLPAGTYRVTLEQGPRLAMARLTLTR